MVFDCLGEELTLQVCVRCRYLDHLALMNCNRYFQKLIKSEKFRKCRSLETAVVIDTRLVMNGKIYNGSKIKGIKKAVLSTGAGHYIFFLTRPDRKSICEDEVRARALDIRRKEWIELPPPPIAKTVASSFLNLAAIDEKNIFVFCTNYRQYFSSLNMNQTKFTWRCRPSPPLSVVDTACVAFKTCLYLLGGRHAKFSHGVLPQRGVQQCQRFDIESNTWQNIQPLPSPGRFGAVATQYQGKFFLIGGYSQADDDTTTNTTPPSNFLATTLVYDTISDTWSQLSCSLPNLRNLYAAVVHEHRILVFGTDHQDNCISLVLARDYSTWINLLDKKTDLDFPTQILSSYVDELQGWPVEDASSTTTINNVDTPYTLPPQHNNHILLQPPTDILLRSSITSSSRRECLLPQGYSCITSITLS